MCIFEKIADDVFILSGVEMILKDFINYNNTRHKMPYNNRNPYSIPIYGMNQIQITQTTPTQLKELITEVLKSEIDNLKQHFQPKEPKEYLTRSEVADLFKVDLSTVYNWCKTGKLKPLGIGARVYFLRSDIENCLTPL